MKLTDAIDKISALYRSELKQITEMRNELAAIHDEFRNASEHDWENISVARRNELRCRQDVLERKVELHSKRAEGISDVREMFLDLYERGE